MKPVESFVINVFDVIAMKKSETIKKKTFM